MASRRRIAVSRRSIAAANASRSGVRPSMRDRSGRIGWTLRHAHILSLTASLMRAASGNMASNNSRASTGARQCGIHARATSSRSTMEPPGRGIPLKACGSSWLRWWRCPPAFAGGQSLPNSSASSFMNSSNGMPSLRKQIQHVIRSSPARRSLRNSYQFLCKSPVSELHSAASNAPWGFLVTAERAAFHCGRNPPKAAQILIRNHSMYGSCVVSLSSR